MRFPNAAYGYIMDSKLTRDALGKVSDQVIKHKNKYPPFLVTLASYLQGSTNIGKHLKVGWDFLRSIVAKPRSKDRD